MKTLVELQNEINAIAKQGRAAARDEDLERSVELAKKIDPLLREMAQRTGKDWFNDAADRGMSLVAEYEGRLH